MSTAVGWRGEIATVIATLVGKAKEIFVDTTNWRLVLQDGVTPGGYPLAKLSDVPGNSPLATMAQGAAGSNIQAGVLEQLLTLSGASVTSTIQIPNRAIVFGVSSRTVAAVTGAPSYGVGVSGNATQFGGGLGASAGSTNSGVIGPSAFYAPTPIVITATSGSFSGGSVRIAIHYLLCGVPTS